MEDSPALASAPPKPLPKADLKAAEKEDDDPVMSIVYCPGGLLPKLLTFVGRSIEIRIHAKYLTSKNKDVQTRQVWGTDVYTDDSDAVAILLHTGHINLRPTPPGTGVAAIFRVLASRPSYPSTTRYNFKSRCWASRYSRTSLKLIKCDRVEVQHVVAAVAAAAAATHHISQSRCHQNANINSVYAIQPTLRKDDASIAAAAVTATSAGAAAASSSSAAAASSSSAASFAALEANKKEVRLHKMTATEKASSIVAAPHVSAHAKVPAAKAKRKVPDATIMFNVSNEPCLKYSLTLMLDRGYIDEAEWTGSRLKREVVYFEKHDSPLPIRYELAREADSDGKFDTYRYRRARCIPITRGDTIALTVTDMCCWHDSWSQVTSSPWTNYELPATAASINTKSNKKRAKVEPSLVPKRESELRVLERHLDWEQFEWGPTSVRIRGKEYVLDTACWRPLLPPPAVAVSSSATATAAAGTSPK